MREIVVLGRRGPAQAAFTNPEVRELGEMQDADVDVDPAEVELDDFSREYLDSDEADITTRKNVEIFTEFSQRRPEGKRRRIVLRFLRSPVEIQGDGKVERLVVARNELYRDESGAIRPRDTGERETLECGLVFRSIGYKGVGLEGIPFDERRGVIPNQGGRVSRPRERPAGRRPLRGRLDQARPLAASSGRTRRTPRRRSTTCSADLEAGRIPARRRRSRRGGELARGARPEHVTYAGWEAIDRAEQERGKPLGRPRVKFVRIEEMLEAARSGDPVAG